MDHYTVTGMSCAACSARVEKAVKALPGVESCSVSLLTNSMQVGGSAPAEAVVAAVEAAGYGAAPLEEAREEKGAGSAYQARLRQQREALEDKESPRLKKRLLASAAVLMILMYFTMGHMLGLPQPEPFHNMVFNGLFQLCLALIVLLINKDFFGGGLRSLLHGSPNMDTLVALGSGTAFLYSLVLLFIMTLAQGRGEGEAVREMGMGLYFETAAMIPTLITVGKLLEARSKGRTTDALRSLMALAPQTARLIREGREEVVPIEEVRIGDLFALRPGEQIPVDGVVEEGLSAVNEAALTGESIPVDKAPGDKVSAATVNGQGHLICRASRVGEDTSLSQIIRMVAEASASKAPLGRIADKVAGIFVPMVLGLALLTFLGWLLAGRPLDFAMARGITVLVISCPCALGLATPVAIMAGSGVGARNGILFKNAAALEESGRVSTMVMDKTGTLTRGEAAVTALFPGEGISERELLEKACSLEAKSEHPLARAVCRRGTAEGLLPLPVMGVEALPGNGLKGYWRGELLQGGSLAYMEGQTALPPEAKAQAQALSQAGQTPLFFAEEDRFLGIIAVADEIREDSRRAVAYMHQLGLKTVMLTGDNEATAQAVGAKAGVDRVIAGVLPQGKAAAIRELRTQGKVAMVGDGINDAPALMEADMGLAIGAGTDVALDAAQVVLMKNSLMDAAAAVRLSRATVRNIKENLFWAFIYNLICIPLSMGLFGLVLKPMYGAAAMSLSSFCVCMNALRLNRVKLYPGEGGGQSPPPTAASGAAVPPPPRPGEGREEPDRYFNNIQEEEEKMTKTLEIEGMMCQHCEARVKKALEALPQVEEARVSHEAGSAQVILKEDAPDDVLKKAVEAQDYIVKSVI